MPKRATSLELTLPHREPGAPAYRWLYDTLREAILAGRLRPGSKLPSTRDLADRYGLARGTVVHAFEHLASEGYLEGNVGSGTFVARSLPDDLFEVARSTHTRRPSLTASLGARRRATHGE